MPQSHDVRPCAGANLHEKIIAGAAQKILRWTAARRLGLQSFRKKRIPHAPRQAPDKCHIAPGIPADAVVKGSDENIQTKNALKTFQNAQKGDGVRSSRNSRQNLILRRKHPISLYGLFDAK
jgi:hypothetical protein